MSPKEKEVKREEAEKIQKIDLPIFLSNQGAAWLSAGRRGGEEEEEDSFAA